MYNYRAEKEWNNGLHRNFVTIELCKDKSLVILLDDMSHIYLTPDLMKEIVDEYINLELPFPDEEE